MLSFSTANPRSCALLPVTRNTDLQLVSPKHRFAFTSSFEAMRGLRALESSNTSQRSERQESSVLPYCSAVLACFFSVSGLLSTVAAAAGCSLRTHSAVQQWSSS